MQGLDRYITGNYGEDSVPPEFVSSDDLGDLDAGTKIDVASQTSDKQIVATITKVTGIPGFALVETEEFEYPVAIPSGVNVYFADDEEA